MVARRFVKPEDINGMVARRFVKPEDINGMVARRFVKPEDVKMQMALPLDRRAKVANRQIEEKARGAKIHRGPGRPEKKIKSPHAITHQQRPKLRKQEVLHLTLKLKRGLPTLRQRKSFQQIQKSFFKYSKGEGFRLTHFSVQKDHLHLIAEADSKPALSKAMLKLAVSLAKRLIWQWEKDSGTKIGRIFKERYHAHLLRTPQEVRNAIVYVINNAQKHGGLQHADRDPFSSAPYFDGYARGNAKPPPKGLLAGATNWLLTKGWRKFGLVKSDYERPKTS